MDPLSATYLVLGVFAAGAMLTDCLQRKIYNSWILTAALCLLLSAPPAAESLVLAAGCTFFLLAVRAFRAGDGKYLLAVSLGLPAGAFAAFLVRALFVAAALSVPLLLREKKGRAKRAHTLPMAIPLGLSLFLHIGRML